ncbi:MAG TPA: hypothetical protein VK009_18395 [Chloroflexota bacterium]|nr:hypothetical protein [Chloroflexota bacterium]
MTKLRKTTQSSTRRRAVAAGVLAIGLAAATAIPALADDHLFTAVGAGGLTTSSQPFLNGTDNSGRPGTTVPGQGSPLSGFDNTVPAVGTDRLTQANSQAITTIDANTHEPPPVIAGKTAPSSNSTH